MSAPEAAFIQAPFSRQPLSGSGPSLRFRSHASSFDSRPSVRRRTRSSPHWHCSTSNDPASFAELEGEIRAYLDACDDPGPNPLAYTALGAAGRTDLVSRIMEQGGYLEVSRRLGLAVDETTFILPPPVVNSGQWDFNADVDEASVVVGRDLEAKLSAAEEALNGSKDGAGAPSVAGNNRRALRAGVPTAQDLRAASERLVPPVTDEVVPDGERFVLSARMRAGIVILAAVTAAGFGRASTGLVGADAIETLRLVAEALGLAHVVVAVYAGGVLAAQYKRNRVLWSAKLLLSGPLGLPDLKSLGSL